MKWAPPDLADLYQCIDHTWPAHRKTALGCWTIREGKGGGKRVSAATMAKPDFSISDIEIAQQKMRSLDQPLLFMIQNGQDDFDAALEDAGYSVIDPVVLLAAPTDLFVREEDGQAKQYASPTPQQIDTWERGGINSNRIDVMGRVNQPKAYFEIEADGIAGAVAFTAIYQNTCMTHAVEVHTKFRRKGLGLRIMNSIANWANTNSAQTMSVVTTLENESARGLYSKLGFQEIGFYHYRIKT